MANISQYISHDVFKILDILSRRTTTRALILSFCLIVSIGVAFGGDQEKKLPLPAADTKIQLTFPDDVPLKTVIDYVAIRLDRNIIYDDTLVKRTVTIRSPVPVDKDELMALLRSSLRFRGLALVDSEQPGWLKVVADEKMAQTMSQELVRPSKSSDTDVIVTRLIQLKYITAKQFSKSTAFLLTVPGGNVIELPTDQTLIVTDYKTVVDAMLFLQSYVDVAQLEQKWSIYKLKNTAVARIADDLKKLIDQTVPGEDVKEHLETVSKSGSFIQISQLNSLLLRGTDQQIKQMESMLDILDISRPLQTQIYSLKNVAAQHAVDILKQLVMPLQQETSGVDQWVITPEAETNMLIITCPRPYVQQVTKWIEEQIDLPGEAMMQGVATKVIQVKYARAGELATTLQNVFSAEGMEGLIEMNKGESVSGNTKKPINPLSNPPAPITATESSEHKAISKIHTPKNEGSVPTFNMTVDEPTNSIIVTGSKTVLAQIEQLVACLDHHRPQVLIDATIVSVSKSETLDLGVQLQYIKTGSDGLERGLLNNFGLLNVDPTSGQSTATLNTGFNAVLLRPNEVTAIVQMARTRLNGRIIARPQLLINDNTIGYLNSITEEPYTSINSSQTVATTSFAGYAEAGVQLTLTPHISEGDVVYLEYEIISSAFTGASSNGDIPPPRATNSVRSKVTIPSGYVLLVGGLTSENQQRSLTEIPFLADIPVIGALFRTQSDSDSESVLYVFLRPVILAQDHFAYLKFISEDALKKADLEHEPPSMEMEFLR